MNKIAQGVNIGETFTSPFGTTNTLGDLVSLIIRLAFAGSGILILVIFMFAGYSMLAGAGQNNPEQAARGRQAATAAALGFVIVFVAYWIVRLIETITGISFITQPSF
ncbi:hypothetical protein A2125_01230 [Candidatus Woesebacteria bacterium GWB1_43_5]|uniref:Integral membrane protein n=1 Tax=Candidatus Woesebacteria bacterium GWB1_43_5 TaxID=1802474 RepID=A0A1F7WSI2_9BACT|nr:MAG: hypothetical protein A2125_01230 [Candidatus Woesebacteria bacterium GWB1_43_5]